MSMTFNTLEETYLKPFKDKNDTLNLYHIGDIKHEEKHMTQYFKETDEILNWQNGCRKILKHSNLKWKKVLKLSRLKHSTY